MVCVQTTHESVDWRGLQAISMVKSSAVNDVHHAWGMSGAKSFKQLSQCHACANRMASSCQGEVVVPALPRLNTPEGLGAQVSYLCEYSDCMKIQKCTATV